ncbi:MAG: hypothetical protein AB7N90_04745, partial [Vicinamibacterales bacterium]
KTQGYAVLWGLHDIPGLQRLVSRLSASRGPAAGAVTGAAFGEAGSSGAPAASTQPSGVRGWLKRLVVAEDETLPGGGWAVRVGRWFCSNMMMYVCVPADAGTGSRD